MIDLGKARSYMVDHQIRTVDVTSPQLLAAFGAVPRERFLPEPSRPLAYLDRAVALGDGPEPRYLIEAGTHARLLQLAGVQPDDRVLDIGCGTGYGAALLARIAREVVALEEEPTLAATATALLTELGATNVGVVGAPLREGCPAKAPYDLILFEGSVDEVPDTIAHQLADGGRLVAVVGRGRSARAYRYVRQGDRISGRPAFDVAVPPLPGFQKAETFVF